MEVVSDRDAWGVVLRGVSKRDLPERFQGKEDPVALPQRLQKEVQRKRTETVLLSDTSRRRFGRAMFRPVGMRRSPHTRRFSSICEQLDPFRVIVRALLEGHRCAVCLLALDGFDQLTRAFQVTLAPAREQLVICVKRLGGEIAALRVFCTSTMLVMFAARSSTTGDPGPPRRRYLQQPPQGLARSSVNVRESSESNTLAALFVAPHLEICAGSHIGNIHDRQLDETRDRGVRN